MHRRASRHVHSDMFFGFGFPQKNMFSPNNCEDSIAAARTSAEAQKKKWGTVKVKLKPQLSTTADIYEVVINRSQMLEPQFQDDRRQPGRPKMTSLFPRPEQATRHTCTLARVG